VRPPIEWRCQAPSGVRDGDHKRACNSNVRKVAGEGLFGESWGGWREGGRAQGKRAVVQRSRGACLISSGPVSVRRGLGRGAWWACDRVFFFGGAGNGIFVRPRINVQGDPVGIVKLLVFILKG
jgi:hypothetical protein